MFLFGFLIGRPNFEIEYFLLIYEIFTPILIAIFFIDNFG